VLAVLVTVGVAVLLVCCLESVSYTHLDVYKRQKQDGAKGKDAKPVPERKKARNLSEDKRFKLFSGTANRPLAEEIGRQIGVPVGEVKIQRFADGEVYFQLLENVRGVDVFVVQPTCYPVDQHLVELLVMIDALKRASAAKMCIRDSC